MAAPPHRPIPLPASLSNDSPQQELINTVSEPHVAPDQGQGAEDADKKNFENNNSVKIPPVSCFAADF